VTGIHILSLSLCETVLVVVSRAFFLFSPGNHIINIKKNSFSGEVKDSVIFLFFFLLHKRAKPILPPYTHPSAHPPTHSLNPPIHPSTHSLNPPFNPSVCPGDELTTTSARLHNLSASLRDRARQVFKHALQKAAQSRTETCTGASGTLPLSQCNVHARVLVLVDVGSWAPHAQSRPSGVRERRFSGMAFTSQNQSME
jgi:hypothetical protein